MRTNSKQFVSLTVTHLRTDFAAHIVGVPALILLVHLFIQTKANHINYWLLKH